MTAAGSDHVWQEGPGQGQGAEVIDLHHGPVYCGVRFDELASLADATTVHHDINAAGVCPNALHQPGQSIGVGEVKGGKDSICCSNLLGQSGQRSLLSGRHNKPVTAAVAGAHHSFSNA